MNIDPAWTPAGLASLAKLGVTPAEVIDVIYAPTSIAIQIEQTRALWIVGLAGGQVITVICDLQARNTTIYEITYVREPTQFEIQAWRSKQP